MSQGGRDKQIFDLLASQPILLGKSQASERHYFKKKKQNKTGWGSRDRLTITKDVWKEKAYGNLFF